MRIVAKHPIMEAIAGLSDYFEHPGAALCAMREICAGYDIRMDIADCPGDEGRTTILLYAECPGEVVCSCCGDKMDRTSYENCIAFYWYKMRAGRYECIKYVS